jgi:PAS domain S-box-containing protein
MRETIPPSLSPQILGQFLLMQSVLWALPDENSIFSFICKGLQDLPGVGEVRYAATADSDVDPNIFTLSLKVGEAYNGELRIRLVDPAAFLPYKRYLENFCFMVAVILEERKRRSVEADHTLQLERHVQERTKALQETEGRFRSIFFCTALGMSISDLEGNYQMVNPALCRILGYTEEELLSQSCLRHTFVDDIALTRQFRDQLVSGESEQVFFEKRYIHKTGRLIWASVGIFLFRDSEGRPQYFITHIEDVSERKAAEEALRESEHRHRVIFENSPLGMIRFNTEGVIVDCNDKFVQLMGSSREKIIGFNTARRSSEKMQKALQKALAGEDAVFEDGYTSVTGGKSNFLRAVFSPVSPGQPATEVIATLEDISERRRAELAMQESEKKWRAVFERSPVGIMLMDDDSVVLECNQFFADIFGAERKRYIGLRLLDKLPDGLVRQSLVAALADENIHHYEGAYTSILSGKKLFINITSEKIAPDLLIAVIIDITEQREAALAQEKLQAQFLQAQKMESVGRLAGGVAHDFNNMLGVILGHVEMALDHLGPEEPLHEDLLEVQKAAQRSAELTRQLLAFARKQTVSPKVLDLNETVEGLFKMLRRLIGEDIELIWKPGKRLWPVKVDPSQIDQILANLCVNARDAISGVGSIVIETSNCEITEDNRPPDAEAGRYVVLTISDNGCGMDRETQEHLFEPFFTTKEIGQGTGLGLATIYGIVRQNGGFLKVQSEPGQGATFRIYLPVGPETDSPVTRAVDQPPPRRGVETILLVEDEPSILSVGRRMLEKLGYQVLAASTPEEALDLAEKHKGGIDLLLTDVVMPQMNGRELAARLTDRWPNLKCLFMSGYTADMIAHHGVLAEGVQFIQKPFSKAELSAKICEVLEQKAG